MRKLRTIIGWGVATTLLVVAIVWAIRGMDTSVLGRISVSELIVLVAAMIASLGVTASLFWAVTRSFDADPPVGFWRMVGLIAASGLLNYVPIARLGLWGRAGYLRKYHQLPIRQSLLILAVVMACAVAVSAGAMMGWISGGVWLIVCMVASGPIARRLLKRSVVHPWSWVLLRATTLVLQAARLWLAFDIIGEPITFSRAMMMAAAGTLAKMTGITPNGLGVREWIIAALAPTETAVGLAAAMLERLVEIAVFITLGAIGILVLSRSTKINRTA